MNITYCGKCGKVIRVEGNEFNFKLLDLEYCKCTRAHIATAPDKKTDHLMIGWKCPVCGRGMSPFVDHCDCVDRWNNLYPIPAPYCFSETEVRHHTVFG